MYYEVWVAHQSFHGSAPLTYSSPEPLTVGQVVLVPLQRNRALAIVVRKVAKPKFATKDILRVITNKSVPAHTVKLFEWLQAYYPAPSGPTMSLFLPTGLSQKARTSATVIADHKPAALPDLTTEQAAAFSTITDSDAQTVLVHGDTGTGKTRLYIELVKAQLAAGKSAIVLTPEIGLTPQLAQSFTSAFAEQVVTLHSNLTVAERRDAWLRVLDADKPIVVIGPRSALFSPVQNLGIVIIDECHDPAYKQEQAPYYQTSRVAAKLASLAGCKMIMGSATPQVTDYYALEHKRLPIVRLRHPALSNAQEPHTQLIDLKQRQNFSRSGWLSNQLLDAIAFNLDSGAQSLIFLNRRGSARLVMCQNCGWQALCPRCDLPLTYHADEHLMRCHTCGHAEKVPITCPDCGNADIIFKTIGTKTLVDELQRHFSSARIRRFDSDTGKADSLAVNYDAIKDGAVDILVGTQMLGKGLDLPKLQLVGVVLADTSLNFPDFTAEERTFQMITQVIGRVGRGHQLESNVIIQTYAPDSPVIQAALRKDYESFYQNQLKERQLYNFPPFTYLLKLSCARASRSSALKAATKFAEELAARPGITISGPSPAFIEKQNDKYHWQIIVRASDRSRLTEVLKGLPANWFYDLDPSNLL